MERDVLVARWVQLAEKRFQSSQTATNESKREDGKGHRPEGGVSAAARELGVDRDDALRAVKVASLSDEAKDAAREEGLDDNRTALLDAARFSEPGEQVLALRNKNARRK